MAEWKKRASDEDVRALRAEIEAVLKGAPFGSAKRLCVLAGLTQSALHGIRKGNGTTVPTALRLRNAVGQMRAELDSHVPPAELMARVRAVMAQRGMTQTDFARAAGIPEKSMWTILNQTKTLSPDTRGKLERGLMKLEPPRDAAPMVRQQPLPFNGVMGGTKTTTVDAVMAARFAVQHPAEQDAPGAAELVRSFFDDPAFKALGARAIEVLMQLAKTTTRPGE